MKVAWALPVALGVTAFALGWWLRESRPTRSIYDDVPIGMSKDNFQRRQARQRTYRRLFWSIVDGGVGFVSGWLIAYTVFSNSL
jgi:hypothetical protein